MLGKSTKDIPREISVKDEYMTPVIHWRWREEERKEGVQDFPGQISVLLAIMKTEQNKGGNNHFMTGSLWVRKSLKD